MHAGDAFGGGTSRVLNREQLFKTIDQAAPTGGTEGALLVVRVQNLRDYETMFGYDTGEFLVQAFEAKLRACLREADIVVRIGECDYAVVLPALRDRNHVAMAAAKVARSFQDPLQVRSRPAWVNVAVGACLSADAATPAAACRQADAACKRAWRLRERHALHEGVPAPLVSYDQLYEAIASNRLQVFLQPVYSLRDGTLKGVESLSRWPHALHGTIGPDVFVPMAEQAGLIHEITRWNINATFRHCSAWLQARPELKCAINISPLALTTPGFVEQVTSAARMWKLQPGSVMLEVTETAFVDNQGQLAHTLSTLHGMGLGISIDDFGTGYSSLSYLKQFPVDELKIDMSFVRELTTNPRAARLVSSIIDMTHGLDALAVAEGIESAETWRLLQEMGCDHGQGYYSGRPQPAEEALAKLADAS